jgi:hypothetical protein
MENIFVIVYAYNSSLAYSFYFSTHGEAKKWLEEQINSGKCDTPKEAFAIKCMGHIDNVTFQK